MSPPFAHRLAVGTILVAITGALLQPMLDEQPELSNGSKTTTGSAWLGQAPR